MRDTKEIDQFNEAMGTILHADPRAVKAAVDAQIQENTADREARGQRKRGRKPKIITSALDRASSAKG